MRHFIKFIFSTILDCLFNLRFLFPVKQCNVNRIGVLFLKNLGFGDILMLSPIVHYLKIIYPNARIYIVSEWEKLFEFDNTVWVKPNEFDENFDMLISPTSNFRHYIWILRGNMITGYFGSGKLLRNFSNGNHKYFINHNEHYIRRLLPIFNVISVVGYKRLLSDLDKGRIVYPNLISAQYHNVSLKNMNYASIHLCNDDYEREWNYDMVIHLIHEFSNGYGVDSFFILGTKSIIDLKLTNYIHERLVKLGINCEIINDVTLPQLTHIITNSILFIGMDNGPSHIALLQNVKSWIFYVSMDPGYRRPYKNCSRVVTFYPDPKPISPLFNGLRKPSMREVKNRREMMSLENALDSIHKNFPKV